MKEPVIKSQKSNINTNKRIVIMQYSGGVGKTTLARYMFLPRMPNADFYTVETINSDGKETGTVLDGNQFIKVLNKLMMSTSVVVDIGISNLESAIQAMQSTEGSHEDVDLFVIPTIDGVKQMEESVKTIHTLIKMGVEPEKIRVLFNMVERPENIADTFDMVIYAMNKMGVPVNTNLYVPATKFFINYQNTKHSLEELVQMDKEKIQNRINELRTKGNTMSQPETKELEDLAQTLTTKRLAISLSRNYDAAFEELFK